MITALAKWWLTRKGGYVLLYPGWTGLAIGAAEAIWDEGARAWMVYPHNSEQGHVIALNGAVVHRGT
jgi:hypothetical protein